MTSRSQLNASINAFGAELRSFVQRASDSITALKRTAEQRPQAGVSDFKECLDDLEQQVADFTDEVQQLAEYTSESISFEELIGHCSAVFSVNRAAALALEQHLSQYGYQQHADAVLEPESLQECMMQEDTGDMVFAGEFSAFTARTRQVCSTPTSPVSKGSMSMLRSNAAAGHVPSRLGRSQPGSPTAAAAMTAGTAARAGGLYPADTSQLRDTAPMSTLHNWGGPSSVAPQTQLRQQQQQQHSRASFGSNTSSTPAGLLISPSVAALANKYATSSVGGSSAGGLSLPEQPSTGGADPSDRRRSPCRDLNLSYALADASSPDMPIFGRPSATPAAAAEHGHHQQQQQALETTPVVQRQARGCEEDSTGELYSSLIHSNMQGVGGRGGAASTPDVEVTPPCTRAGVSPCGSPQAPATAGRLPPTWVSEKMQQLENLQADVTLTLSQMKRCPSRSRTSTPVPGSDSEAEEEQEPEPRMPAQQQEHQEQQQQQHGRRALQHAEGPQQLRQDSRGSSGDAAAEPQLQSVAARLQPDTGSRALAAGAAAAAPAPAQQRRAGRGAAHSLTAAAAAASADLESLMASLSMKYSLGDNSDRSAAGTTDSSGPGSAQEEEEQQGSSGMELDSEAPSPSSPASPEDSLPAAGFSHHYACSTDDRPNQQQQQHEGGAGVGGSTLLTPATQQTIRRVVALGGTAARPQSSIRRLQPTTDVHRLEEIRGFYHQQTGVVPQQLDARLQASAEAAAAAAAAAAGSSLTRTAAQPAAAASEEHTVLRPMQLQERTSAAVAPTDTAASAAAGLRQSRQRQQQQEKPKQQQAAPQAQQQHQEQSAEALTPRAARLQRRLQLQQQQQHPGTENACPAAAAVHAGSATTAAATGCGGAGGGLSKAQGNITAEEFGQLPSWCRSLLSVELLNGVLQELPGVVAGRSKAAAGCEEGFTAEDVTHLGHSGSKSKTIVSCLHKLGRASLQRSVTGGSMYKLC